MAWFDKTEISYAAIMYYLVFNTVLIIGVGYCIVGCLHYPYSFKIFNNSHFQQCNERFGSEFIKCTERVVKTVEDMYETQSYSNSSVILVLGSLEAAAEG